jgi:hypothetical protein
LNFDLEKLVTADLKISTVPVNDLSVKEIFNLFVIFNLPLIRLYWFGCGIIEHKSGVDAIVNIAIDNSKITEISFFLI